MRVLVMDGSKIRNILGKVLFICLLGTLIVFCIVGIWMYKYEVEFDGDAADERKTPRDDYDADDVDHVIPIVGHHMPDFFGLETSTFTEDESDYRILLNAQEHSSSGKVYIQTGGGHLGFGGQLGFLCNDGFTQADAGVVCRELGYPHAAPYHFMAPYPYTRYTTYQPVLKSLNCTGYENKIKECSGFQLGNITSCTWFATVVCYHNQPYKLRLVNGIHPDSGIVEIQFGDEWGSFCALRHFNDDVADILCRNMNYTGGVTLQRGELGEVNVSRVWVPYITCGDGTDVMSSILECQLILHTDNIPRDLTEFRNNRYNTEYMACQGRPSFAAAVQCFKDEFLG